VTHTIFPLKTKTEKKPGKVGGLTPFPETVLGVYKYFGEKRRTRTTFEEIMFYLARGHENQRERGHSGRKGKGIVGQQLLSELSCHDWLEIGEKIRQGNHEGRYGTTHR